jgi:hypothetical protein
MLRQNGFDAVFRTISKYAIEIVWLLTWVAAAAIQHHMGVNKLLASKFYFMPFGRDFFGRSIRIRLEK